ncbi:MAG: methyltransferase domain-containing protein [Alphaproteobacteria bacterium]|nr:methyltransferase domain-containing protein [Alphaproteobacteria bacterium]
MAAAAKKRRAQPAAAVSAADARRAQKSNYIPLKLRFQAWWEGIDAETLLKRQRKAEKGPSSAEIKIDEPIAAAESNKTEFELLMSIQERVWGKGQIVPGGEEYAKECLAGVDLRPGSVALDLSAGLGGSNRAISVALDAMVEGLEMHEGIAKMGAARAADLALEKQAPVSHFLAHNFVLRVDRYQCVYGHEVFHKFLDKQNMLSEIWKSLKDDGHLVFTDLIYGTAESEETQEIKTWSKSEPVASNPWTAEDYKNCLAELGFEIIAFEDETSQYRDRVRDGWAEFAETLDDQSIDRRFVDVMMHEAEIWQHRMKAMKAGHLRFLRVHARRPKPDIR